MRRKKRNYNREMEKAYNNKILARATGMITSRAIGPYWAAPLHPSVEQVSQNSVLMYDGVLLFRHSSLGALTDSQKQLREMTYLSFTENRNIINQS